MRSSKRPAFVHDPSATEAFAALPHISAGVDVTEGLRAVVIGGGTGAPVSIRTLLSMDVETSAVVAMADDGGSTGILRDMAGATTPGDVRKCITAMAKDPENPLTQAFKMRFTFAENHTLGNLMLSALEQTAGSFPSAIETCEKLLECQGHVYPSTLNRVTLMAQTRDGRTLEGQAVACHSRTALSKVALRGEGDIVAYRPAVEAIERASLIVLGPGSLYTSIIPNLLVDGIVDAVRQSNATVLFVCSLADMQGETRNMTAQEHYEALCAHGMRGLVDYMLINKVVDGDMRYSADSHVRPVVLTDEGRKAIVAGGTCVVERDLADDEHPTWHSPSKLRNAILEVLRACRSARM